ncbi:hypothetical protein F4561_003654 [Lipingzhangella halophila]|uniref:HTH-type transcriptional repressor KstR2 C-terminal domain-containing protein n=1 Tax=Lipingzhangella halophila TaxID=1783352 RepID=A0A7W7W4G9_9ACTN|nr:hypothetical protein [Lipingzhangella halophila]MBB4932834.1 hypothetical protein [Lipingzhangella halophila]
MSAKLGQAWMTRDHRVGSAAAGAFATPYPAEASRVVTTMCVAVATWYRPDGPLAPEEVVRRYLTLARATVGGAAGVALRSHAAAGAPRSCRACIRPVSSTTESGATWDVAVPEPSARGEASDGDRS